MVIRVEKNKYYTTMSNYHLWDKKLSLKAKGLMSFMLSLPEDWDYTVMGLVACLKEGRDGVRVAIQELEKYGYLTRRRVKDKKGIFRQTEYILVENPKSDSPTLDFPTLDSPTLANPPQQNTNYNKILKELNTDISHTTKKGFVPPTLEEVGEYIQKKGYQIDAQHFLDYYEAADWHFANGKPVKSWKQCLVTWSRNGYDNGSFKQEPQPTVQAPYFSREEHNKQVQKQLEELYKTL